MNFKTRKQVPEAGQHSLRSVDQHRAAPSRRLPLKSVLNLLIPFATLTILKILDTASLTLAKKV
jgi:hypothetical protein